MQWISNLFFSLRRRSRVQPVNDSCLYDSEMTRQYCFQMAGYGFQSQKVFFSLFSVPLQVVPLPIVPSSFATLLSKWSPIPKKELGPAGEQKQLFYICFIMLHFSIPKITSCSNSDYETSKGDFRSRRVKNKCGVMILTMGARFLLLSV